MIRRLFFEMRYLLGLTPWDTGISPPELMRFIDAHPSGRALDIGCGTGTNALTLAERGWKVTGIDFSTQAIARARRNARRKGLEVDFLRGDVNALNNLAGPFDLSLDIGCYHSLTLTAQAAYADRLSELLPAGGICLIYSFLRPKGDHESTWPSEESMRQHFGPGFEIVSVEHGTEQRRASAWFTIRRVA